VLTRDGSGNTWRVGSGLIPTVSHPSPFYSLIDHSLPLSLQYSHHVVDSPSEYGLFAPSRIPLGHTTLHYNVGD
jgi:hypothetical protein